VERVKVKWSFQQTPQFQSFLETTDGEVTALFGLPLIDKVKVYKKTNNNRKKFPESSISVTGSESCEQTDTV